MVTAQHADAGRANGMEARPPAAPNDLLGPLAPGQRKASERRRSLRSRPEYWRGDVSDRVQRGACLAVIVPPLGRAGNNPSWVVESEPIPAQR